MVEEEFDNEVKKIKIIRKWLDKSKSFQLGQDSNGKLYCRDVKTSIDLVLIDPVFKKGHKFHYKFINPKTGKLKLIERM